VLVLDAAERRVAGAGAGAVRVLGELAAELDHEVLDDPVEVQPVVEALLRQGDEVAGGARHLVTVDLGGEGAEGRLEGRSRVRHAALVTRVPAKDSGRPVG
jgi:hypothetical protein